MGQVISISIKVLVYVAWLGIIGCGESDSRLAAVEPPTAGEQWIQFVREHTGQASVSMTYHASPNNPRNVRNFNVTLFSQLVPMTPIPRYADGTPAASAEVIGPDAIAAVVDQFGQDGFFDRCVRWHSEWQKDPTVPPPADSRPFDPSFFDERHPEGALQVRIMVSHDQWHHNFQHTYPLNYATRDLLQRIASRVPANGREAIERGLLGKMR